MEMFGEIIVLISFSPRAQPQISLCSTLRLISDQGCVINEANLFEIFKGLLTTYHIVSTFTFLASSALTFTRPILNVNHKTDYQVNMCC
jgi:hypothetical protein